MRGQSLLFVNSRSKFGFDRGCVPETGASFRALEQRPQFDALLKAAVRREFDMIADCQSVTAWAEDSAETPGHRIWTFCVPITR